MARFVDFTNIRLTTPDVEPSYEKKYDKFTTETYKGYRISGCDPITLEELTDDNAFKVYNIWNPYTGETEGKDPFGPLLISPITLLTSFYINRLNGLWVKVNLDDDDQDSDSDSEGEEMFYFGDGVGIGEDWEVVHKGKFPEKYLFRIPIANCYLPEDHNMSIITMGPKLTDQDIDHLDSLLTKHWSSDPLFKRYYPKIGSLRRLKRYYDIAISKDPLKMNLEMVSGIDKDEALLQDDPKCIINRSAVEVLKGM